MKKIKSSLVVIGVLLLVLTGSATRSEAEVNVSVGINLPVFRFSAPPEVVVIPGTYVYIVPDIDVDILFYQGYWWRPYEGRWYRSRDYRGQWRYVKPWRIPRGLKALPHDYRYRLSPGYERVPYGNVQKNWKKWEREKYWDRRGEQDRGGRDDHNRGRHGEHEKRY
ncbi:MAG: hypothetical protein HZC48_04510 [Nitrospirae bacterium]|nr:hypothetical protein [Nitrospirota bacterium]